MNVESAVLNFLKTRRAHLTGSLIAAAAVTATLVHPASANEMSANKIPLVVRQTPGERTPSSIDQGTFPTYEGLERQHRNQSVINGAIEAGEKIVEDIPASENPVLPVNDSPDIISY